MGEKSNGVSEYCCEYYFAVKMAETHCSILYLCVRDGTKFKLLFTDNHPLH